jgi:hypothetical protein
LAAILEPNVAKAARRDVVALGLADGGGILLFIGRFLGDEKFVDLDDFAA